MEHRTAGQGTSANLNPPQPGLPLDRPRVQAIVANQTPIADQIAPVATKVYERQIANIQRRLDQQAALQRRLDEQDQLLRQQEAALELRSRENQQRHQSLIGRGGHIDPANLFNTPPEHQAGGNPVVQTAGRAAQNRPAPVQGGSPAAQTRGTIGNTGAMLPPVPRFHTPAGHYRNPADNL